MDPSYNETVYDFDLNLLEQTETPAGTGTAAENEKEKYYCAKIEKLRRSVIFLKKKILFSNSAVARFKLARNYATILENNQVYSKEGCKQHLVEIRNFIDKVDRLEDDCRAAQTREAEKDETINELKNTITALEMCKKQLMYCIDKNHKPELLTDKVDRKKCIVDVNIGKKGFVKTENENLTNESEKITKLVKQNKGSAKITNLEKEIASLRKENTRITNLEKENERLRQENTRIMNLEKENERLRKENARIQTLEKEIENLNKKNTIVNSEKGDFNKNIAKIRKLEKELENVCIENAKIPKLKKEIEILQNDNAKIPKLMKEIDGLRKENAKIIKLGKENEALRKDNLKILNLEKEIEILRIKNAKYVKLEREHKALCEENVKIADTGQNIQDLTHLTCNIKRNGNSPSNANKHAQKHKSLPNTDGELTDNSEAEHDIFEDALSPTSSDTNMALMSPTADKDIMVPSVDTGRGSSLAHSDSDKYLHSPEYLSNNSHYNGEIIENNATAEDATMTKRIIILEDKMLPGTIPLIANNDKQINCENNSSTHRMSHPNLLSPIDQSCNEREISNKHEPSYNFTNNEHTQNAQENECQEQEYLADLELENIFSTMKLNYNALTPIPKTPTWAHETDSLPNCSTIKEKILRCLFLGCKSDQLLLELKSLVNQHTGDVLSENYNILEGQCESNRISGNNNIDKILMCYESILKAKEILMQDSVVNTKSTLEFLDGLSYDNKLIPISSSSSTEKDTYILQDEQEEEVLTPISWPMIQKENQNLSLDDDNNLVLTSNQSSLEINTTVLQDKQEEIRLLQKSLLKSTDQEVLQPLLNQSVSRESNADNELFEVTNSVRCPLDSVEVDSPAVKSKKQAKLKKNITLEKIKKKLQPKYKISREKQPINKSKIKPKQHSPIKKKVTVNDTCATLNNKDAYEKAVKIMAEENSKTNAKIPKSPPKHSEVLKSPKRMSCLENDVECDIDNLKSANCSIITRSGLNKRKFVELFDNCSVTLPVEPLVQHTNNPCEIENTTPQQQEETNESPESLNEQPSKKRRRRSFNEPPVQNKRVLRSSTVNSKLNPENNIEISKSTSETNMKPIEDPVPKNSAAQLVVPDLPKQDNLQSPLLDKHDSVVSYDDLDLFSESIQQEKIKGPAKEVTADPKIKAPLKEVNTDPSIFHPKESILCRMIEKYGVENVRPYPKKIPDHTAKQISDKIEEEMTKLSELPLNDVKNEMNRLVEDLKKLNYKHLITGLMKYLTKPDRKQELFGKVFSPPAPPMTKAEEILLYVMSQLQNYWPSVDFIDAVLTNIEYTLFKLNRTPEFDVIESTSHFYALLCRYLNAKSRLRVFILDAMYCFQFKSVPLIKQCLEVWMHIIPLAHMGIAKCPLVTCLVYLLHFYKCEDKFNRVQEIRNILSRKYFYQASEWNESKILEMLKNSIKDLKDVRIEMKMLRLSLIILAKRQGPRWCQNNIVKNLLQPMIEKEAVPSNVKEFCVSMIGPLMKPYPIDMKVHCEIAMNQLTDILNNNPSPKMQEAALKSMMSINRHDQRSINKTLLSLRMQPMSLELEKTISDYVKTKPLKVWKKMLPSIIWAIKHQN